MGHTLLLRGSALGDCGLRSAENLAQFLGAGSRSGEVWVLVGCLGLVIFLCVIDVCLIVLWNLSDPRFHCNRFGTRRDRRCEYLPVFSESQWRCCWLGRWWARAAPGSGRVEGRPCPWPAEGRGARFGGGGPKLSSWKDFLGGLAHSYLTKGTCHAGFHPHLLGPPWTSRPSRGFPARTGAAPAGVRFCSELAANEQPALLSCG